jgi:LDH2 family malate/lactate/ureidoglycolate dehydrogenase
MAGHKGYVIAMMMDMLAGVLTGSGFGNEVHGPYQAGLKSGCGHLMIAMNIESFQPLAEFNARMERYIAKVKAAPLAGGFDEVFYPGEIEARNDAKHRAEGLAYPDATLADLAAIATQSGLKSKLPF